jgi:hypothetical protein
VTTSALAAALHSVAAMTTRSLICLILSGLEGQTGRCSVTV